MFTGLCVLLMIGAPERDIERPLLDQYKVFVQSMYGARLIHKGSTLLYEKKHIEDIDLGTDTDKLEPVDSITRQCISNPSPSPLSMHATNHRHRH